MSGPQVVRSTVLVEATEALKPLSEIAPRLDRWLERVAMFKQHPYVSLDRLVEKCGFNATLLLAVKAECEREGIEIRV